MAYPGIVFLRQVPVWVALGTEKLIQGQIGVGHVVAVVYNSLPVHLAVPHPDGTEKDAVASHVASPRFFRFSLIRFKRRRAASGFAERFRTRCVRAPGTQTSTQ